MHMLAEASVTLVQSAFACVVLKSSGETPQAQVISRKAPAEQIEKYAKSVARRHFAKQNSPPSRSPVLFETDWAGWTYEFPLVCSDEIAGILSIAIPNRQMYELYRPSITALALIGEYRLLQILGLESASLNARPVPIPPPAMTAANPSLERWSDPYGGMNLNGNVSLTRREQEVLSLVMQGLSNLQIAEKLFISAHTVKNHITKIYEKLGVADRTQAMAKMYRNGHQLRA